MPQEADTSATSSSELSAVEAAEPLVTRSEGRAERMQQRTGDAAELSTTANGALHSEGAHLLMLCAVDLEVLDLITADAHMW